MNVRVTGLDKLQRDAHGYWSGVVTVHLPASPPAKGLQVKVPVHTDNGLDAARRLALFTMDGALKSWHAQVSAELAKP